MSRLENSNIIFAVDFGNSFCNLGLGFFDKRVSELFDDFYAVNG